MRKLGYLFAIIVAILPMLWTENYTFRNPVWWTVVIAWYGGRLFGWFEGMED
jgi:hypothetical protein